MKKIVAALAMGVIVAGTAATSASAEAIEVEKGDSLWNIAEQYNTTVDELVKINDLKTNVIQPKQQIVIDNNEIYKVVKGDTLSGIGSKYGVTVGKLKKWNELKSDTIHIGQKLEIQGVHIDQKAAPAKEAVKEEKQEKANKQNTQNNAPEKSVKKENKSQKKAEGKTISVTSTAYTATCDGCSGTTSTGVNLKENPTAKVIAVDPNVIPLGTKVYVEGYGYATAADTGGAIKGNKIDIHVPTKDEAYSWGVRTVNVTIID